MRFLIGILLLLLLVGFTKAQNLVPNYSFEQKTGCPTGQGQINLSTGWFKVSSSSSTEDYYNSCFQNSCCLNIPSNTNYFFQEEYRNCNAYVGLYTWSQSIPNYREQIGIELDSTLMIGTRYYLSFLIVNRGARTGINYNECPSNNMGIRLTNTLYSSSNPAPIDNFSHLKVDSAISDTLNWYRITGSIIADSAYKYIMIGNFYDDANTDTTSLNCPTCWNQFSYYLIDDICISIDSITCNGGLDGLPCSVGVFEQVEELFALFPNPTNGKVNISLKENTPINLMLYNAMGQIVFSKNYNSTNTIQLDLPYPQGIYFLRLETPSETFTKRLIKK